MSEDTTRPLQPTVWITRTVPAAFKSAANWANAGYAAAVGPILDVTRPRDMPDLPPRDGVVVFTSSNAAKAFAEYTLNRQWSVVTVGFQTKHVCHDLGFRDVITADGTSEDVTRLLLETYTTARPIYHCAGNHVRGTIIEDLKEKGYRAQRDLYYLTTPVKKLPKIDTGKLDFVTLYSPLAAKTLVEFAPDLTGVTVLSLSAAIDEAFGDYPCKARYIAKEASEPSLIDAVPTV